MYACVYVCRREWMNAGGEWQKEAKYSAVVPADGVEGEGSSEMASGSKAMLFALRYWAISRGRAQSNGATACSSLLARDQQSSLDITCIRAYQAVSPDEGAPYGYGCSTGANSCGRFVQANERYVNKRTIEPIVAICLPRSSIKGTALISQTAACENFD